MSITDKLINNNPDKYETIIQARILGKQLQMKLNQYNSLQREYNNLLEKENNNRKRTNIDVEKRVCVDKNSMCNQLKNCCPDGTGSNSAVKCGPSNWMKENCQKTCNTCKHEFEPVNPSGYWIDLQDENYQKGMVSSPDESTEDWKFLGKSDNLTDCKLKAVHDKETSFSSIVYYPEDIGNEWNKSCFAGITGGEISSSKYQQNVVTSIPPNGTTRLGGKEGEQILNQMKRLQDEIQKLSQKVNSDNNGLKQTSTVLNVQSSLQHNNLENVLKRLKKDRQEINKLISEPNYSAEEEDSHFRQLSSYTNYGTWRVLVLTLLFIIFHLYSQQSNEIPIYVYLILTILIYILGNRIYGPIFSFFSTLWYYISYYLVYPIIGVI